MDAPKIALFPEFTPLEIGHEAVVMEALIKKQPKASEQNFTELFMWSKSRKVGLAELNGNIIVRGEHLNDFYFHPPYGINEPVRTLRQMLEYAKTAGKDGYVYSIIEEEFPLFGVTPEDFIITDQRDQHDYVYLRSDLVDLPGRKFDAKRNHIKKFNSLFKYEFVPLDDSNIDECIVFQDHWCKVRNCSDDLSLEEENTGVMEVLKNFKGLSCIGGVLTIDGRIKGFTIASRLNKITAVVSVEKADPAYKGIYQTINNLFCANMLQEYEYVNREQDMGSEGLRKAKMSYNPDHMVEKKHVKLR
jgi:hypothetical protein